VDNKVGAGVFSKEQLSKDGMVPTKEFGFMVEEEVGKVLAFDRIDNQEYGRVLLFGDQVFFLSFWDSEELQKAGKLVSEIISEEIDSINK